MNFLEELEELERLRDEAHRLYNRITNQITLLKKRMHPLENLKDISSREKYSSLRKVLIELQNQRVRASKLRTAAEHFIKSADKVFIIEADWEFTMKLELARMLVPVYPIKRVGDDDFEVYLLRNDNTLELLFETGATVGVHDGQRAFLDLVVASCPFGEKKACRWPTKDCKSKDSRCSLRSFLFEHIDNDAYSFHEILELVIALHNIEEKKHAQWGDLI